MDFPLSQQAADLLFRQARTFNAWQDRPVDDATLHALYDLMKYAPTSANCSPARIWFVRGAREKKRLLACVAPGNLTKTETAPVTAIIAHDMRFYDNLPKLFPHTDAKAWFVGNDALIESTAFRNGTLQAGYMILAARAVGLDCGPMSGFDNAAVDRAFFPDGRFRSNILCNLGYGDTTGMFPRSPRLDFDESCRIL